MTDHPLDRSICDRAREARDARFDGLFFVGVHSTGIYCRPICPAPSPRPENIVYYPTAAAAAAAGLRPCLRCRPETAPGTPAWDGTAATVSRAMTLIRQGALDRGSVEALAGRLGIGARHLRRLFRRHIGATPKAMADTQRLLFAKQLVMETRMPLTEAAFAAGYGSLGRFNAAFRKHIGRPPSALRRGRTAAGRSESGFSCTLALAYRPPYAWSRMLAFFRDRAIAGVEWADDRVYRRTLRIGATRGTVTVRHRPEHRALELALRLNDGRDLMPIVVRIRRMFDLDANPRAIHRILEKDPLLAQRIRRVPGLRLPGAWDPFETAVRAVVGQQVSVKGAVTVLGRIARLAGTPLPTGGDTGLRVYFPRPADLLAADLSAVGMPGARQRTLRELARQIDSGALQLDPIHDLPALLDRLTAIPGIGDWTANYVAMRALSEPDAFPAADLGILRALAQGDRRPTARQAAARAEAWRPWRAYAAVYLWLTEDK